MSIEISMPKSYKLVQKIKKELKPNPNNFIIVKKWNCKYIYNRYKFELFNTLSEEIEKEIPKYIENTIKSLVLVKEV